MEALDSRYTSAKEDARTAACLTVFERFEDAASRSVAVICRSLTQVSTLVADDTSLLTTFAKEVRAASRVPEENVWDMGRGAVENAIFPNYRDEIRYGAISITGNGLSGYGGCSIVLRDETIRIRSTVFDQPLFPFMLRHSVVTGQRPPAGYRATWERRGRLAAAKLGGRLDSAMTEDDFQDVLVEPSGSTEADCIEVHIYGPIHRLAIERVIAKRPTRRADKIILKHLERNLEQLGARLEKAE